MRLRGTHVADVLKPLIHAHKSSVRWPLEVLEAHVLAGGNAEEAVKAAIVLRQAGFQFDRDALLLAQLQKVDVTALAWAYLDAVERHPNLTMGELLERAGAGESVVRAISMRTFLPRHEANGWRARLEYGPMTGAEARAVLGRSDLPPNTTLYDPGADEWINLSEAQARLGKDGGNVV